MNITDFIGELRELCKKHNIIIDDLSFEDDELSKDLFRETGGNDYHRTSQVVMQTDREVTIHTRLRAKELTYTPTSELIVHSRI